MKKSDQCQTGQARAGLMFGLFVLAAAVAGYGLRQHLFEYVDQATAVSAPSSAGPRLESVVSSRPPAAWEKTFGDHTVERANAVAQLADGSLVFAGGAFSPETSYSRATFFLLDRDGALIHNRLLPGAGENEVLAVVADDEGGVYLAGLSNYTLSLTKTSAYGDVSWHRTFDGEGQGVAHDVALTPQGDILLAGSVGAEPKGRLWRLTATGRTLWSTDFGAGHVFSVRPYSGGGSIVAGVSRQKGFVTRLGQDGQVLWTQEGVGLGTVTSLGVLPDGDIVGVGQIDPTDIESASQIIRLRPDGSLRWTKAVLADLSGVQINALGVRPDGGVVMAGHARSADPDQGIDMQLIGMNADGDIVEHARFGGAQFDTLQDVIVTSDGGIVLAGYTFSKGAGASDVWFASLGPDGQLPASMTFEPESLPAPEIAEPVEEPLPEPEPVEIEAVLPPPSPPQPAERAFICQVFCETGNPRVIPYPVDVEAPGRFGDAQAATDAMREGVVEVCRSSGGRVDRRQSEPVCRPL